VPRRHHIQGMAAKNIRLDRILSGIDARTQEHVLKMFEAIKGRKPTPEELAQLRRKIPNARDEKQ
jgi:hypothetical protein